MAQMEVFYIKSNNFGYIVEGLMLENLKPYYDINNQVESSNGKKMLEKRTYCMGQLPKEALISFIPRY